MKISHKSSDILVVRTETIISIMAGILGLVVAGIAIYYWLTYMGTVQERIYYGQAGAAITLLLIAVVLFDKTTFMFDRGQRRMYWKRRTVFSNKSGSVDFDDIKAIIIQSISDNDNHASLRVAVITNRETLPLGKAYTSNSTDIIDIASFLNQWVLDRQANLVVESAKAALAQNCKTSALKILRHAYPLSLNEAMVFLDHPERLDALPSPPVTHEYNEFNEGQKETLLGIIALITLVCGPLCLFFGINGYIKGVASESWPDTEAEITKSGYAYETENDEALFAFEYSYTVAGMRFTSNALYLKPIMNDKKSYSAIPKWYLGEGESAKPRDYPRGKRIIVYYNPEEPELAVVKPGVSGSIRTTLATGVILTIIYLILARRDLRRRATRKTNRNLA